VELNSINFFTGISSWDWKSIFYSFVASIIFAVVMKLIGGKKLKAAGKRIALHRAIKKYKSTVKDECSSLIVIGRRAGFNIHDVYVDLDLARSDLNTTPSNDISNPFSFYGPKQSCVLVGGPGAGKSTTVKKIIINELGEAKTIPFIIRLREYHGYPSIEACLISKLQESGVPDPEQFLKDQLLKGTTCVLDGLDEVRPHLREEIYRHINIFYAKHFVARRDAALIVSCRKEAYRNIPLDLPEIFEVRPLTDEQIIRFAERWPLSYPKGKSKDTFWRDLGSAEKILQLARSPLLLIGGLMQYTESNQGIPEERFEYLKRVANWLVADWATAQGHPPDPNRPVYDRVLPKIAFEMQQEETSELSISKCIEMLKDWLPTYGYDANESQAIIESIATKTGILVREGGNNVVFAQFGLQEYFASLEVMSTLSADQISILNPISWWRETILLTTAQLRNPSDLLEALFETSPLLAVSAVAECPTPSISMQHKAIDVCLGLIDGMEKAVGGAAVTLLRKLKGTQEAEIIKELEKRLSNSRIDSQILSLVGLSLATAGTPRATALLAKYPEVWDACLKEVSYLSTSFENLLVEWIEKGNDEQSARAIDMIVTRLSGDRTKQLLKILPKLPKAQAQHLASSMLRTVLDNEGIKASNGITETYTTISECIPRIHEEFFEESEDTRTHIRHYSYRFGYKTLARRAFNIWKSEENLSAQQILQMICNAEQWSRERGRIVTFFLAGILLLSYFVHDLGYSHSDLAYGGIMAIFLFTLSSPVAPPPWAAAFLPSTYSLRSMLIFCSIFLLGMLYLYTAGYKVTSDRVPIDTGVYLAPILMIIASHLSSERRHLFSERPQTYWWHGLLTWAGTIFAFSILALLAFEHYNPGVAIGRIVVGIFSIIYLIFLLSSAYKLFDDWRKLKPDHE